MDDNMLLNLALDAGEMMLTSGAETYRVEDTMERILSVGGDNMPEAIALSTMLMVSIHSPLSGSLTMSRKVPHRSINFTKISLVNSLSREFVSGKLSIEAAYERLYSIHTLPKLSPYIEVLCFGITTGAFTLTFLGTPLDGLGAFLSGIMLGVFMHFLSTKTLPYFLNSLLGSVCAATFAILFYEIGIGSEYSVMIVGGIMPLLPGVIITNAIRDTMEGNLLSGTSKIMEALLIAIAVASGAGFALSVYTSIFV